MSPLSFLRSSIVARIAILLLIGHGSAIAAQPPKVNLAVPTAFGTSVSVKHYGKGQDLGHDPSYHLIPVAPVTEYHGWFGPRGGDQSKNHGWVVRVYAHFSERVAGAYAKAKDGFDANLNEGRELLGSGESSDLFARFERKRFRWGNAVSFFSQSTQDDTFYVPHNGHLAYEVWGVTADRKFTVVARVSVSHPELANWSPEVRSAKSVEALRRDRDFKRIEKCKADAFTPKLTAFDRMLDSLVVR